MSDVDPSCCRCWAEIDLDALCRNARTLRTHAGGADLMAVIKANAYGHGAQQVARALGWVAQMFGVANLAEAREVRATSPDTPIFILSPALPEERRAIVRERFLAAVSGVEEARAYAAEVIPGTKTKLHLALDTGMGRMGIWEEEAFEIGREIAAIPEIEIDGITSHLPVADEDAEFTQNQLIRFHALASQLIAAGISKPVVHIENSAGILGFPSLAGNLIRGGLALYGSSPLLEFQQLLSPVLTWKARITMVRDIGPGRGISYGRTFVAPKPMRVATLSVGYADGYARSLSGHGADVLIQGRRCAVLGRVTMDQIMADVTDIPTPVGVGEEVILIGRQGSEEILAAELAEKAQTIAWEIFTGLGSRVGRRYSREG